MFRVSAFALLLCIACSAQATALTVLHTIEVGKAPHGIRFADNKAYIALSGDDEIGVLDLNTNQLVKKTPVENVPLGLIQSGDSWIVAPFRADYLLELDIDRGKSGQRWDVGSGPSLFSPKVINNNAYIVSEFADQFTVFDVKNRSIVKTYQTGDRPYPADVTDDGVLAFVPNRDAHTVSVIDLLNEKEITQVKVCEEPEGGSLTTDNVYYLVACGGNDQVMRINTASFEVVKTISEGVGPRPFSVVVSEDGDWGFVNNAGGETLSVIDLATNQVVQEVKVGQQPIVMRTHKGRLYVTNEVSGTLSILQIDPKPTKPKPGRKNEVIMLGVIHSGHKESERYSLPILEQVIRNVDPDYVLTEIPPNRLAQAIADYKKLDRIEESRVRVFPEYTDVLFPLTKEMDFEIIPTAGWNTQMNDYRRSALGRIREDEDRAAEWAEYTAANQKMSEIIGDRDDDPAFIHSDEYDGLIKAGLEPYDRLFNDELGTGGWTTINKAHYALIDQALNQHSGEGKRMLITFGAGHKYWFLEQLRKRDDIILINPIQFFP